MFSVLYTHQKAKKAKTWQDGILKVNGNKAKLCDEESKLLDSFFIHSDQVSAGEELESDRYLITIEERLDSSADHAQGCNSQRVEQREVSNTPGIYQPNKRKRQCFQPPKINQTTPALSRHLGPEYKKPRRENVLPKNTNLNTAESRVPSKNDFFNMYSTYSSNRKVEGDSRHHGNKQEIPSYNSSSVLQRSNLQNLRVTPQRHDQVVPLNVTGPSKGGVQKENKALTNSVPSKSTIPLQKGSFNNRSFSEGKRNTTQILALFSAFKNTPRLQLLTDEESKNTDQASIEPTGKSPLPFEGNLDKSSSPKDAVRLGVETKKSSETAYEPQINATDSDSPEQDLVSSEDLCNSFNLSPDSFAACSSEKKAEVTSAVGQISPTCDVAFVATLPDDDTQDWESHCETQLNDAWSHDSESVSPLMKHLTSAVQDHNKSDSEANANSKVKRGWLCDFSSNNSQLPKHFNIHNSSSPTAHHSSSVLRLSTDSCLIQKYPQGSFASEKTIGEADFIHASPLTEQNLLSFSSEASTRFSGTNAKDVSLRDYENIPQTQSRTEKCSIEMNGFSSHPGSAFAYTALECVERSDKSLRDKRFGNLEPWNASFGLKDLEDTDNGLSPEFYPPDSGKVTQWRVAPIVSTKVVPTDSRTVKAGEGHSWKGSVVSDTVKRDSHSVPMVTVQRQELYTPTTCPQGDQRIPSSDLTTWVDSISSTDMCEDSPCFMSGLERGFATSESLALSSTQGFIKNRQFADQNHPRISDVVQRVPQLSKRRAPILTAPREDHGIQQTVPENTLAHKNTSAGMYPTKHYSEFSNVSTAFHGESKSLCDGTELAVKENKENSAPVGSCRRVGLRRVGLGKSRELRKNQQEFCQTREGIHEKQDGYRPPTVPSYMAGTLSGDRSMAGQLYFPTAEECDSSVTPTRQITVPVTFEDVMQYKQVFKAALREHLNIVLFELARSYYSALQKVDVSGFDTNQQGNRQTSDGPSCHHGQARLRAVKKDGPNKGRLFYTCSATGQSQCKFFKWADEYQANKTGSTKVGQKSSSKLTVSSPDSLMSFLKSHNVAFYCECRLLRKHTDSGGKFGAAKTKKWGKKRNSDLENRKKGLYLELPRKEHSSTYSKDDIWIISKKLSFDQESTFIASSVYYGPSSSGELEITPISGYSPSNWTSGEIVHALMACNAGTELTCIGNIEEHVKLKNMPVLSYILQREQTVEPNVRTTSRTSSFVPPMLTTCSNQLDLPSEVTESLAEEMIARFDLNKDQATALLSCARMFNSSVDITSPSPPVCLIHGVFGAGKSFLLAVAVLYLVELFKVSDSLNNQSTTQSQLKILVSSTTNVAVDRILLGLLELGFDEFVRVGSIRKIAKPVLPYSVHSTGSDSQELKELQGLLKTELTPSERTYVRKSIERHKLGENKKKLSQVRVVGVTCAACVFPCLDKLKFQILLLDECSQMTEPASLLPMARFECQKLVLVGDPKQLSPTIQGSEPEHEAGLEQTLFDRLMKMGYEPTLLRTQYRCHPAISAISNRLFYDNKLFDGVSAEDRSPIVNLVPTLCFYNVAKGREKCGNDGSYYNEEEAKFVVFLIESLLKSGMQPSQIGVITLYKSQLRTVASQLTASGTTSHAELKAIQISTVDAFQGGEKDVIILSCVRTDHIGFIDCDKRSNVALTRAKRHLLIVGNLKMLSCNAVWGKVIEHCGNFPNGLCNSDEFIEKCQGKESNALDEDLEDSKGHADQLSNVGRQNAVKVTSDSSSLSQPFSACAGAVRKGFETETRLCEENTSSVDIIDTNGGGDEDSDFDLPTFDLISSLGI